MVGYQKVPFGFQETTSSSKIKTIERSATNRFFADDIDFAAPYQKTNKRSHDAHHQISFPHCPAPAHKPAW
jgi:hypothetical protein